jgi:tight adherence protein C
MSRRARRDARLIAAVDVIEFAALSNSGGLNLLGAVEVISHAGGPFGDRFTAALESFASGRSLPDALVEHVGDEPALRPLIDAWCATERYGTPLGPVLEHLVERSRDDRRRLAEVAARRVPVLLLFPLVCCVLPAVALMTVVPLIIGSLRGLTSP